MKCNIEYTGKLRCGRTQYFCTSHKHLACDKSGNKLDECLCSYKELFDNKLDLDNNKIDSLRIVYDNILENQVPNIFINDKLFKGVLVYNDSVLTYKDLSGILLAKINNIKLESVSCNHCKKLHSDNGMYAYTPHRTHFCNYCGHLFRVKEKNISHELEEIFTIPNIKLKNNKITITNNYKVEYDLFKGTLLINDEVVDTVIINNKEENLANFLNRILKNEY